MPSLQGSPIWHTPQFTSQGIYLYVSVSTLDTLHGLTLGFYFFSEQDCNERTYTGAFLRPAFNCLERNWLGQFIELYQSTQTHTLFLISKELLYIILHNCTSLLYITNSAQGFLVFLTFLGYSIGVIFAKSVL